MRRQRQPTPVLLPGKSHGWRGLVGCSPWGGSLGARHDWVTSLYFSLSCIGEGNGNPLQCSCLENPRDVGAWWAAIYGVAQGQTRLKRLSSSSSRRLWNKEILMHIMRQLKVPQTASHVWSCEQFIRLAQLPPTTTPPQVHFPEQLE